MIRLVLKAAMDILVVSEYPHVESITSEPSTLGRQLVVGERLF